MAGGVEDKQPEVAEELPQSSNDVPPIATTAPDDPKSAPAVRFQSTVQQFDFRPSETTIESPQESRSATPISIHPSGVTPEQLKALTNSLEATHLQGLRIANFAYEPVSLPASRTASHEDDSRHTTRQHTPSSTSGSPMLSPKGAEVQSPPLTPLGTEHLDAESRSPRVHADNGSQTSSHSFITPQGSTQDPSPTSSKGGKPEIQRPVSADDHSARPVSAQDRLGNHRKGLFNIGPTTTGSGASTSGGSLPGSREASPSRKPVAAQYYTRPLTPSGDANDPYAANRRPPQNRIEPRFMFSKLSRRKDRSPSSTSMGRLKDEKRHSAIFGGHHRSRRDDGTQHDDGNASGGGNMTHSRQNSMSDLKRFFKLGPSHHHRIKRAVSPAVSVRSSGPNASVSKLSVQIPFGDEHSLTSKYGKLGKVLGSGAGGSVRLMKRSEDNTVFAVKEFRARHSYESEKEYVKKLTAEYCIGSSLHHGNIIETLDIIREKNRWYEVMEYAPYDLFAIVMTGRMTRSEVACCFLQILSGVTYLHGMGLAHRDLKLDNVVVSEYGIMKIIDFGSAHVFQYPFENGIVLASGIVGSDPYLAPEVYDDRKYDPTAVDIWSLAIIFCCMTLRRFPWKIPRATDNSYKLFSSEPTPGHDPKKLLMQSSESAKKQSEAADPVALAEEKRQDAPESKADEPPKSPENAKQAESTEKRNGDAEKETDAKENCEKTDVAATGNAPPIPNSTSDANSTSNTGSDVKAPEKREVIKGPWRILRLLPRESRHVIGGMLTINPKERIKMAELLKDPWVANTVICRQVGPGKVIRASTHTHVLEQPSPPMK